MEWKIMRELNSDCIYLKIGPDEIYKKTTDEHEFAVCLGCVFYKHRRITGTTCACPATPSCVKCKWVEIEDGLERDMALITTRRTHIPPKKLRKWRQIKKGEI